MASEYLKWKYKDVTPDAPPPPLTGRKKVENWFRYHWLYLLAGAVILLVMGSMLWEILGIGQVKPDYILAYIGKRGLSEDASASLTDAFAALGEDVNGDGRVVVTLRQYVTAPGGDDETALQFAYAADARLLADATAGDSFFFLAEDPKQVQRSYHIFSHPDGTPPADDEYDVEDKVFPLGAFSAFAQVDEESSGLYLGRRSFYSEKLAAKHVHSQALWHKLLAEVQP